jgi:hypothetical protein
MAVPGEKPMAIDTAAESRSIHKPARGRRRLPLRLAAPLAGAASSRVEQADGELGHDCSIPSDAEASCWLPLGRHCRSERRSALALSLATAQSRRSAGGRSGAPSGGRDSRPIAATASASTSYATARPPRSSTHERRLGRASALDGPVGLRGSASRNANGLSRTTDGISVVMSLRRPVVLVRSLLRAAAEPGWLGASRVCVGGG